MSINNKWATTFHKWLSKSILDGLAYCHSKNFVKNINFFTFFFWMQHLCIIYGRQGWMGPFFLQFLGKGMVKNMACNACMKRYNVKPHLNGRWNEVTFWITPITVLLSTNIQRIHLERSLGCVDKTSPLLISTYPPFFIVWFSQGRKRDFGVMDIAL